MVQNGHGTVSLDPDSVKRANFSHAFRGYDTHEVQAYLLRVSEEMARLTGAADAAAHHAESNGAAVVAAPLTANEVVGDEAGRVLQAAEDAAQDIRAKAEDAVAKMLRDAQDEVTAQRSRAQQERVDIVAAAETEAHEMRVAAADELEEARADGRAMVEEAREIRERVLSNLAEKRQLARRELAQLKAGIKELRTAYGTIEELLAASIGEVDRSVPTARAAAMRAGEQVPLEPEPYVAPEMAGRLEEPARAEVEEELPTDAEVRATEAVEESADVQVDEATDSAELDPEVEEEPAGDGVADGGTVIDLQARRADLDAEDDPEVDDEVDPQLPEGDAIDEIRQAERRQLFEETDEAGETVVEFTPVMEEFGPADEPVPLVPPREAGDIDELFARIRESRTDAVAQAREVMERTSEIPIIDGDDPAPESELVPQRAAEQLAARDAVLDELAPDAVLALKRVLSDQLNEVLDVLRRHPDGVDDVEKLIPPSTDRVYGEAIRDLLSDAASRGATGSDTDIAPVVKAVGSEVGGALRARVVGQLHEPDQLERRVRSAYREWRRDRAGVVATDSVAAAYGLGVLSSVPEGTPVRWLVPEQGCCGAECYDNTLATDVFAGDPFPTGDVMAPARPGCRGLVVAADQ